MVERCRGKRGTAGWALVALCILCTGCHSTSCNVTQSDIPRELQKASLPSYVIEPPDILEVDAIRVVPKPPYHIEALDSLFVQVSGTPAGEPPIEGSTSVDPDGSINLGVEYGKVQVLGLTLEEAQKAIQRFLIVNKGLDNPKAQVSLAQSRGEQLIRGDHLVRPDGTISLGLYGKAYVAGLTIEEAKKAIERVLADKLVQPEISVDVLGYNSKVYYIITDGAAFGETIVRLPYTGNETVLDALAQSNWGGIAPQASKCRIWVARPAPVDVACKQGDQILRVDYNAIAQCGQTATNWQLFPGDRVYVASDPLIKLDGVISIVTQPFERLFGFTLFGQSTILRLANQRPSANNGLLGGVGGINGAGTGIGGGGSGLGF